MPEIIWIAADWGTTNLRVFAVGANDEIVDQRYSSKGMISLKPDEFEAALLELIDDWLSDGRKIPVFACGMVGAKQGWKEAEYQTVPCAPVSPIGMTAVNARDPRIDVNILPGISQLNPPDVMRGEETQIAGFLAHEPEFSGVVCLPGTHSKWVKLSAGKIIGFKTLMTGELFGLLCSQSVLKHSVEASGIDMDEFLASAARAIDEPSAAIGELFSLRAAALLCGQTPETAKSRLSGLLIGHEMLVTMEYWKENPVVLVGTDALADKYRCVLETQLCNVTVRSSVDVTVEGLRMAHTNWSQRTSEQSQIHQRLL